MVKNKQIVKQMFTNQTPYGSFKPENLPEELKTKEAYEKKVNEIMDDMYYNTIWRRIEGDKKYFNIYKNGRLLDQASAAYDQQKWLE